MAHALDTLFDHLVRAYAVPDELVDIDLSADASDPGSSLDAEKQQALEREMENAQVLRGPFKQGLSAAYQLRQQGIAELALNDRIAEENAMADALIRYLVSFGLAASRTEDNGQHRYTYYVNVDWDELQRVGAEAGVDTAQALAGN